MCVFNQEGYYKTHDKMINNSAIFTLSHFHFDLLVISLTFSDIQLTYLLI
jgi:hypothetical protein